MKQEPIAQKCRSCGAPIHWIKTASGKAHPIDAQPEKRWVRDGDGWALIESYISHFSTCPQGKKWSKKGG